MLLQTFETYASLWYMTSVHTDIILFFMFSSLDSQQSLQEEEREKFRESLHAITSLTSILLAREMNRSTN